MAMCKFDCLDNFKIYFWPLYEIYFHSKLVLILKIQATVCRSATIIGERRKTIKIRKRLMIHSLDFLLTIYEHCTEPKLHFLTN